MGRLLWGALACVLCVGVILGIDVHNGREALKIQSQRVSAHVVITRRWTEGAGDDARYLVAYHYADAGPNGEEQSMSVSQAWYDAMVPGVMVSTRFVKAAPEANTLNGRHVYLFERWLAVAAVVSVLLMAGLFVPYIRQLRKKSSGFALVRDGQTAVGEVVNVAETNVLAGLRPHWRYDISYRFSLPDGRMMEGLRTETSRSRQNWAMGSLMTVLFDPRNPERHALYSDLPGQIVSHEGR
jgi:hypothetical protein